MISANDGADKYQIISISLPNFEISWAGGNPLTPGYCFGSDDGEIEFTGLDYSRGGPQAVAPSREAINGVAFAGRLMAVSTRSEVVFLDVPQSGDPLREHSVFHGGVHGVVGTPSGGFVAPMGRRGILLIEPNQMATRRVKVLKPADEALNIYKVVSLASPDRGEVLACAARRSGLAVMPLTGGGRESMGKRLRPPGVDFIDVAALGVEGYPLAAVASGLDCSLYFVRDLVGDGVTKTLRFKNTIGERAYRVLCAEGHVFLLTNKNLYAFANLAARFLHGESIDGRTEYQRLPLEAVDASVARNRSLLVVMSDCVHRIEIDSFIAGGARYAGHSRHDKMSSGWESFDGSPWGHIEELELMAGIV